MTFNQFRELKPNDKIRVARYAITGRKPCVDEDTGEPSSRAIMRKVGSDVGRILKCNEPEMVTVQFDQPVPDINNPAHTHAVWSVYFRDVIGHA